MTQPDMVAVERLDLGPPSEIVRLSIGLHTARKDS